MLAKYGCVCRLHLGRSVSYLTKLESLAASAVRSADKVSAKLIIVYTQTGLLLLFWSQGPL